MGARGRDLTFRLLAPATGLAAMAAFAVLYKLDPESYYRVLKFIGVPAYHLFIDLHFVLASVDCWQQGVNVYVNNPCDMLHREYNYSPLWLRLSFLPGTEATNPLGLCLAASFFLSLAALPTPHSGKELLLRIVATLSPVTAYAVERANVDVLIFVMAVAAGIFLIAPSSKRVMGYLLIIAAGLLKFYPFVLMILTFRERLRAFLWVNSAVTVLVLAFGVYFHAELAEMAQNIPHPGPFGSGFGAYVLPDGAAWLIGIILRPAPTALGLVRLLIFAVLFGSMALGLLLMLRWHGFRVGLARLPEPEKVFLVIGAALISGCFFAGGNIGYRGIHLLFALPGVLALARVADSKLLRIVAMMTSALILALMWAGFATWGGSVEYRWSLVFFISWLGQEIIWWLVATLFFTIVIGYCLNWLEVMAERPLLRWRRGKG